MNFFTQKQSNYQTTSPLPPLFYRTMNKPYFQPPVFEEDDQLSQTDIPYYIAKNAQSKSKKNDKTHKQTKDSQKNNKESKDTKDPTKVKAKSQNSQFVKDQHKDNLNTSANLKNTKEQIIEEKSSSLKVNIKEELSYLEFTKYSNVSQEKLAKLYIQHKGDIQKLAFMIKIPKLQILCKMVLPIIKNALRTTEAMVKKRKLRRVFLAWNDHEMKEFIHKFFEIRNGQLFGYSKKIDLTTYWKIIESKYDGTITLKNDELHEFYKSCLDLHLSVYEDIENRGTDFERYMTWSRAELKVLCRLLLKTDNLQKVSDVMTLEFGRLKQKFSPRKIFEKIDTLIKMSISKIKQQSVTYPGLGEIRKMMKYDFYNINYNQEPRYDTIRKELIRYFERDSPNLQESYAILHKLNRFIIEERIHEKNQISEMNTRDDLLGKNAQLVRNANGEDGGQDEDGYGEVETDARLDGDHLERDDQVKIQRTVSGLRNSKLYQSDLLRQSAVSNAESVKSIHPQLKNLIQMDLELSSSDEQQPLPQPKLMQSSFSIQLEKSNL